MMERGEITSGFLPHEIKYLHRAIDVAEDDLKKSNLAYGEAVASSGGDWAFDDPSSQVAAQEAQIRETMLASLLGIVAKLGTTSNEIQYPDETIEAITFGSYVDLELNGTSVSFFIVTHRLPGLGTINGIEVISADSLLGAALIDKEENENITWELPNGRKMNAKIIKIDQKKMKEIYER